MAITVVDKTNTIEQFRVKTNIISSNVGDGNNLSTFVTSTNIVAAMQELLGSTKALVAVRQVIEGSPGWSMTPSDLTGIPAYITYEKGLYTVKTLITWVSENPTVIVYQFKTSTTNFATVLTETIAYDDTTGNVSSIIWS